MTDGMTSKGVTETQVHVGVRGEALLRALVECRVDLDRDDPAGVRHEERDGAAEVGAGLDDHVVATLAEQLEQLSTLRSGRRRTDAPVVVRP